MLLWLTILLVLVALIGLILMKDSRGSEVLQIACFVILVLGVATLVLMVMVAVNNRVWFPATVIGIAEMKRTIEQARQGEFGDIERASLQTEILRVNRKIVKAKYWRQNKWTYIFYHPGVMDLELLY